MPCTIQLSSLLRAATSLVTASLLTQLHACSVESDQPPPESDLGATAGSLRSIMQGMETAASQIASGIWTEDYDEIRRGAAAIADHPPIPESDREVIQQKLGDAFAAFARLDRHVHDTAVELSQLAEQRAAIGEVLASYQQLQAGCIGCHTPFRARQPPVVSD